ncbi:MAG: hypothetical protein M1825_003189 [Sarcosagium campestre]|nr:MAG: hypothetical protein M1825_003189 [Sarcosagium campestre]
MKVVSRPAPEDLYERDLLMFRGVDRLLSDCPIIVLIGRAASDKATSPISSSAFNAPYFQAHIYTPAGFYSYDRLPLAVGSALYGAVAYLPAAQQGDEICRALACALAKCFKDISDPVKHILGSSPAESPGTFDLPHAGRLASVMCQVANCPEVLREMETAIGVRTVSAIDLDLFLPAQGANRLDRDKVLHDSGLDERGLGSRYGDLIAKFGLRCHLPAGKRFPVPLRTSKKQPEVLTHKQKASIRLQMCEFVDTEENYIKKLGPLIELAEQYQNRKDRPEYAELFPRSLLTIRSINTAFHREMCRIMNITEDEAIAEVEGPWTGEDTNSIRTQTGAFDEAGRGPKDKTGVREFAAVLQSWTPKFRDCYSDYLGRSSGFSDALNSLLRDRDSPFAKQASIFGEQRLRSVLLEPVQRLPRYGLYIDGIVNMLCVGHDAIAPLLTAGNVLRDICSLNTSPRGLTSLDKTVPEPTIRSLRRLVANWPQELKPRGRVVTAADYYELDPPFSVQGALGAQSTKIMVLCSDMLIFFQTSHRPVINAQGLMKAIEENNCKREMENSLNFLSAISLLNTLFSEGGEGAILIATPIARLTASSETAHAPFERHLYLFNEYEGQVKTFAEVITKAKIEGRVPLQERESGLWELRELGSSCGNVMVLSSIRSASAEIDRRRDPTGVHAKTQVIVDDQRDIESVWSDLADTGMRILVLINSLGENDFHMTMVGPKEDDGVELPVDVWEGSGDELAGVLRHALSNDLPSRYGMENPAVAASLVSTHRCVLHSLACKCDPGSDEFSTPKGGTEHLDASRKSSPRKMFKTIFGMPAPRSRDPSPSKTGSHPADAWLTPNSERRPSSPVKASRGGSFDASSEQVSNGLFSRSRLERRPSRPAVRRGDESPRRQMGFLGSLSRSSSKRREPTSSPTRTPVFALGADPVSNLTLKSLAPASPSRSSIADKETWKVVKREVREEGERQDRASEMTLDGTLIDPTLKVGLAKPPVAQR